MRHPHETFRLYIRDNFIRLWNFSQSAPDLKSTFLYLKCRKEKHRDDAARVLTRCNIAFMSSNPVCVSHPVTHIRSHTYTYEEQVTERAKLGTQFDPSGKAFFLSHIRPETQKRKRSKGRRVESAKEGHNRVTYRDAIRSRVCYIAAIVFHSKADRGGSSSAPRSGNWNAPPEAEEGW